MKLEIRYSPTKRDELNIVMVSLMSAVSLDCVRYSCQENGKIIHYDNIRKYENNQLTNNEWYITNTFKRSALPEGAIVSIIYETNNKGAI
jgi:hypothetical protein